MATYLSLVNDVLARMREDSVSVVSGTDYSTLIGKFINDAKRQVEDSFTWNSLKTTITIPMVVGQTSYTVTGSGNRFKVISVINDTTNGYLISRHSGWIEAQNLISSPTNASPQYYCFNGVDSSTGDVKVDVFPAPNSTDSIKFNFYIPQAELSSDATVLLVPSEPVIAGAYARALVERGEDGGLDSSEAYGMFKNILADMIALESVRFEENDMWVAT